MSCESLGRELDGENPKFFKAAHGLEQRDFASSRCVFGHDHDGNLLMKFERQGRLAFIETYQVTYLQSLNTQEDLHSFKQLWACVISPFSNLETHFPKPRIFTFTTRVSLNWQLGSVVFEARVLLCLWFLNRHPKEIVVVSAGVQPKKKTTSHTLPVLWSFTLFGGPTSNTTPN